MEVHLILWKLVEASMGVERNSHWNWLKNYGVRARVGVTILDQPDKIYTLLLDVPYGSLYWPTHNNVPWCLLVGVLLPRGRSKLLRAIADVQTKTLYLLRFGVLLPNTEHKSLNTYGYDACWLPGHLSLVSTSRTDTVDKPLYEITKINLTYPQWLCTSFAYTFLQSCWKVLYVLRKGVPQCQDTLMKGYSICQSGVPRRIL